MTIEGAAASPRRGASAWAWSAAARARSSAACTASRRGSTTATSWSPVRCRPTPARAAASAAELHIAPERSLRRLSPTMARREAAREDGIDVVAIVTPNHLHGRIASAFLDAGIDVICDKPMTTTLAEALDARRRGARDAAPVRADAQLQRLSDGAPGARDGGGGRARRDPRGPGRVPAGLAEHRSGVDRPEAGRVARRSGASPARAAALGDIGSHAEHLARFISGLELAQVSADLHDLRPRPPARRQLPRAAALHERRARHALVEPGRARQRECAARARLRQQGRPRVRARSIPTSSGSRRWASRRS